MKEAKRHNQTLPYKFTAKELDKETGLYYYGARYLDPKYSRWISTDPALGEYMRGSSAGEGGAYNSVNLNLYHYGNNNPVKYSDPDGNWVHIAIGAAIGGIVGGVSAACASGSARDVVAATVGGAVTGGLAAATCGASLGTAVAGSAMASTIGYLTENIAAGRETTAEGIVVSAVGGAAGAMAGAVLEKAVIVGASKLSTTVKSAKNIGGKTYQTYTNTGEVYSGRTSGYDKPELNVHRRDANHHMSQKGFGRAVLDKSSSNPAAIRGREQQLIDMHGGAKSAGGSSGNAINGISPNNKNRDYYIKQSIKEFD